MALSLLIEFLFIVIKGAEGDFKVLFYIWLATEPIILNGETMNFRTWTFLPAIFIYDALHYLPTAVMFCSYKALSDHILPDDLNLY